MSKNLRKTDLCLISQQFIKKIFMYLLIISLTAKGAVAGQIFHLFISSINWPSIV